MHHFSCAVDLWPLTRAVVRPVTRATNNSPRYRTQYALRCFRVRGCSIGKSGTLHVPVDTASFYVSYINCHQKLNLYLVNNARTVIGINSISFGILQNPGSHFALAGIVVSAFKSTIVLFCAFFSVACFFYGWSAFCVFLSGRVLFFFFFFFA